MFLFLRGGRDFVPSPVSKAGCRPAYLPVQWVLVAYSLKVKWLGFEVDHLQLTPLPLCLSGMHMDSFAVKIFTNIPGEMRV
jgi:hypothetical protein